MIDHVASRAWARANWFVLLLPPLIAIEWAFARSTDWSKADLSEPAMLFDLCLFMPALYAFCYRGTLSATQLLLRSVGLACLGVYVASMLVPPQAQLLLPHLYWPRMAGLAVLALIELKLIVTAVQLVFLSDATSEELVQQTGAPLWIARLMLLEARFWKAAWRMVRGR